MIIKYLIEVILLSEFLAAIVGGIFTLAGTFIALWFQFRKDDKEQPWGDMGIHQVSIMTNPSTKKSRILARDETPLAKLQINTNLYKGMKVDRSGKRDVQIYLIVDDGKMTMYSIRCKSGDIADKLCQTIKNAAASC